MAKKNGNGNGKQKKTAGRVLGPVQIIIGESIDPIHVETLALTRGCVTNEKDEAKGQTMGSKFRIPYALYRHNFYISARDAEKTKFSQGDLARFLEGLVHMFDNDRSSSRGEMVVRGIYLFKHELKNGNEFAHRLLARVKVSKKAGVDNPLSFEDYEVTVDRDNLPSGVTIEEPGWNIAQPADPSAPVTGRIDGVLLIDVKNGNPNGDPDQEGRPRQCQLSGRGLITDVCLKRKIRNYILSTYNGTAGMGIFFQAGAVLDNIIAGTYDTDEATKKAYEAKDKNVQAVAQQALCRDYFDIRTFGAVLSTGDNGEVSVESDSEEE